MMPAAMIAATASPAVPTSSNDAMMTRAVCGFGISLTVTSVDDREHPFGADHERQQVEARRVGRVASRTRRRRRPSSAARTFSTLWTVRPYFRQCTPPEFSATLPPMLQAICDDGSGA